MSAKALTLDALAVGAVQISSGSAPVTILGGKFELGVVVAANCDEEDDLDVLNLGGTVFINTFFVAKNCPVTITVPENLSVSVVSGGSYTEFAGRVASLSIDSNGSVYIHDTLETPVYLQDINGNVDIVRAAGSVNINGVNGYVAVSDSGGPSTVKNVNGDVRIARYYGNVTVNFVNGSTVIEDSNGSMDVRDTNGKITLRRVTLPALSYNTLRSSNGSVSATTIKTEYLPTPRKFAGLKAKLSARNGDVRIKSKKGKIKGNSYSQTGPSSATLRIYALNGDATLKQ